MPATGTYPFSEPLRPLVQQDRGPKRTFVLADRDLYALPDVLISDDGAELEVVLKPIFDMLWQSFGFERSPNFDKAGRWVRPQG